MDKKILFGKKIREIRNKTKLTQEQFSELIGIESPSLSNIENGKSYPSMQTLLKIIEKFQISPQEFFDNEYYKNDIETEILNILKKQPQKNKRILYRIIKSFDL